MCRISSLVYRKLAAVPHVLHRIENVGTMGVPFLARFLREKWGFSQL